MAWLFGRKFDGERCLAFRAGQQLRLMTRNRQEVTSTYPEIADALQAQQASDFITDGEIVAFDGDRDSFCPAAAAARGPRSGVGAARRGAGVPVCVRRAGLLYHLWSAGMTYHGAHVVLVWLSMASKARW